MSIRLIFFHEFVKSVDEPFDNHADITLDNFFIKESVILLYHRRRNSGFLIHDNLIKKR